MFSSTLLFIISGATDLEHKCCTLLILTDHPSSILLEEPWLQSKEIHFYSIYVQTRSLQYSNYTSGTK